MSPSPGMDAYPWHTSHPPPFHGPPAAPLPGGLRQADTPDQVDEFPGGVTGEKALETKGFPAFTV